MIQDNEDTNIGKKIYCKSYLRKHSGIRRIIGFLDSGSDMTICQEKYIQKLFNEEEIETMQDKRINYELTSFSNTKIAVKYSIILKFAFEKFGNSIPIKCHVISDIPGSPPL